MKVPSTFLLLICLCVFSAQPCGAAGGPAMEKLFAEGDSLLASGDPQGAIQAWRKIWELESSNIEELFAKVDVYERFANAYERMGSEGLPVAAEYLRTVIHYRVPENEAPFRVRLGDLLWKMNRYHEAAQEYRSAIDAVPMLPNAQLLLERIAQADQAVPASPDAAGTLILEPWPTPIECSNPPDQLSYHWTDAGVREALCAVINEYGRRDGYLLPRSDFQGKANLSIQVESDPESRAGSAAAPDREASDQDDLPVTVYHYDGKYWRRVLSTNAHSLRYQPNKKRGMPDIEVRWNHGEWYEKRELRTVYHWDGKRFRDSQLDSARKLNKQAVARFAKGEKQKAIGIWQKAVALARVPGLGLVPDAEILNNLGHACISGGCDAEKYLGFALQVDPYRWQTHLDLGDYRWNNKQQEKATDSYSQVLRYNPAYRHKEKLKERIERTRNAVAALHEVPIPDVGQRDDHECGSFITPYAKRYANASGLDENRLAAVLGIKQEAAPTDDRDVYIMMGRGEYVTSSTVRIYELLRAKMKGRSRDSFFILYNINSFPGPDEDQQEYSKGWRLAEMSEDYSLTNVHDLSVQTKCEWPEHFHKKTALAIAAGELTVTVTNAAVGRNIPTPGGSEYIFIPGENALRLKKVKCLHSVDDLE